MHELNEDIGKLLAKAEQLGAEGNVDESQKILMEVEKVRAKKKEAEVWWCSGNCNSWLSCVINSWAGPTSLLILPAPPLSVPAMCWQVVGGVM